MLQRIVEAILAELAADVVARAAHTGSIRAAALDHEAVDDAVEDQAIIKALLYQADEVVYGVGSNFRIKLRFHNVTIGHGNGNDGILCHNHNLLFSVFSGYYNLFWGRWQGRTEIFHYWYCHRFSERVKSNTSYSFFEKEVNYGVS